jgi:hypothetical protein
MAARPSRIAALLLAALAAGLLADRLRAERLVFARPLPVFTKVPSAR